MELKLVNPDTGKLAYGVNQVLKGKNGSSSKGYKDYAGISVLGAWHWLPELEWGVVTEIDKQNQSESADDPSGVSLHRYQPVQV